MSDKPDRPDRVIILDLESRLRENMRKLQRLSARSRWVGMTAAERSAIMRAVRRRMKGSGRPAAKGEGQGAGQAAGVER